MKESRDYLEMTFRSINCFANDGKLSVSELDELLAIARRDGRIDQNEARVLGNIINRLTESELDSAMQAKVAEIKQLVASAA